MKTMLALFCLFLCAVSPLTQADSLNCGSSDALCGPRSLLVVCHSLGVEANLDELALLSCNDRKAGTTLLSLRNAAEAKGLHAVGMKIGAVELSNLAIPVIAYEWGDHFTAVQGGEHEALKVTDHPTEPKLVPLEEFEKTYSGFALLVAKEEKDLPKSEPSGPDLRADAYNWDFGFIEQGEQAGHTFTLENKGVEDLLLSRVETSCSCTQAFLPKDTTIPPGGKAELTVGFDSTGREGCLLYTSPSPRD